MVKLWVDCRYFCLNQKRKKHLIRGHTYYEPYPSSNANTVDHKEHRRHLSLYLKIDESNSYSNAAWSVNVYHRLFVYDKIRKDYLAVQDAKSPVRTYDQQTISEWGFGKFLTLAEFN